jgi:excisionase family DNA binding protein
VAKEEKKFDSLDGLPMFISVLDAAKVMGLSYSFIYSAIKGGVLPSYRFGSRWKIKKEDLLAFINDSKIPGRFIKPEDVLNETNQKKEGENNGRR